MNSVHAAITSGPPTAVIGLSFRSNAHATIDAKPDRDRDRAPVDSSARTIERSRTARNRNTNSIAR